MSRIILRQYLEITSIEDLKDIDHPGKDYHLNLISKNEFQLNKFLYKIFSLLELLRSDFSIIEPGICSPSGNG